jgi:hypothetical protein
MPFIGAPLCTHAARRALGLTGTLVVNGPMDCCNPAAIARGDGVFFSRTEFDDVNRAPLRVR